MFAFNTVLRILYDYYYKFIIIHGIINMCSTWFLDIRISTCCRSCHTCQVMGKPDQKPKAVPLRPISVAKKPFSHVTVDCVGPLPEIREGNQYLLTIMCTSTRFPEAVPLRNITTSKIVKALIKFFMLFGLPHFVQSDQGSNFIFKK